MSAAIKQTIEHWSYLQAYAQVPRNEVECEKLRAFAEELIQYSRHKKDVRVTGLLRLIARNIESYEAKQYPLKALTPVEMLQFLMEQHNLGQRDLPEIGCQSLVSKILSGERQLTVEHIRKLAKRFGVSPAVFC